MTKARTILLGVIALGSAATAPADEAPEFHRYINLEAKAFSIAADGGLDSYQRLGGGSCSAGGTFGFGFDANGQRAMVRVNVLQRPGRLTALLTIEPDDGGDPIKKEVDLGHCESKSVQLADDADGRVYVLNLMPKIVEVKLRPEPFSNATDDLYTWGFTNSRVLLNGKRHIGEMLGTGGQVSELHVSGIAEVTFSLHHLKDAEPWGRLENGTLTFAHPDGTTISIGNVTNGAKNQVVSGGPYQVWVRWNDQVDSVEESRAYLSAIAEQLEKGEPIELPGGELYDPPNPQLMLANIRQQLAREPGPWVAGYSARGLQPGDLAKKPR